MPALGRGSVPVDCPEPRINGARDLWVGAHPPFEGDVGNREAVFGEQIAQTLQAFDLAGSVVSMTARSSQGRDEASLLEITEHALRPPGRLARLLDGHRLHRPKLYHDRVRFSAGTDPAGRVSTPLAARRCPEHGRAPHQLQGVTGRHERRGALRKRAMFSADRDVCLPLGTEQNLRTSGRNSGQFLKTHGWIAGIRGSTGRTRTLRR